MNTRNHLKTIVIPAGIGRRGIVDDIWLTRYLPVIHKFSLDMEKLGKRVIITLSQVFLEILVKEINQGDDSVNEDVLHYKSLLANLPVLDNDGNVCKKNTVKQNHDDENLPDTEPYLPDC